MAGPPACHAPLLTQAPFYCQLTPPGALKELPFFPQMFLREKQIQISPTHNSWVPDFSSAFRSCVAHCPGRRELLGRGRGGLSHPAPPQCRGGAEPATRPDQLPRQAPHQAGTQGHSQGSPLKPGSCQPHLWGWCGDVWARLGPRPVGATVHLRLLPSVTPRGTPVPTWTPDQCFL